MKVSFPSALLSRFNGMREEDDSGVNTVEIPSFDCWRSIWLRTNEEESPRKTSAELDGKATLASPGAFESDSRDTG